MAAKYAFSVEQKNCLHNFLWRKTILYGRRYSTVLAAAMQKLSMCRYIRSEIQAENHIGVSIVLNTVQNGVPTNTVILKPELSPNLQVVHLRVFPGFIKQNFSMITAIKQTLGTSFSLTGTVKLIRTVLPTMSVLLKRSRTEEFIQQRETPFILCDRTTILLDITKSIAMVFFVPNQLVVLNRHKTPPIQRGHY